MKKIITLSTALMAVSVVASAQVSRPMSNRVSPAASSAMQVQKVAEINAQVSKHNVAPFAAPAIDLKQGKSMAARRNATAAQNPFYTAEGFLGSGIWYNEEDNTFGYNYNACYIFGSSFTAKFVPQTSYSSVMYGDYTLDQIGTNAVDEDGNFSVAPFGCPGAYYSPKMDQKKANASYTYGDLGVMTQKGVSAPAGSIFYLSNGETMSVGAYELWSGSRFYSAYSDTPAYGSYGYTTETGKEVKSNTLMIDMGNLHGFVVESIQFACINHADENGQALNPGDTLWVTLYDIDPNDILPAKTYETIITVDNMITDASGWNVVTAQFAETDEDGFDSEISPVIYGDGVLVISGFAKEGMSCAIPMIYRAEGANSGEDQFGTHAFFDLYVDGVLQTDEEGYPAFYGDDYTDCALNFNGHFAYIGDANGNFNLTGTVPTDAVWESYEGINYTWAVSAVIDGQAYNDFDMCATDKFDEWEFEFDEEKILGIDIDSTYIEDYGVYMIFVAVTDKLAEGESTVMKVYDKGEVCSTITISNGDISGIKAVNKDAEKEDDAIFNLQGVKVANSDEVLGKGIYIRNGKKIVK